MEKLRNIVLALLVAIFAVLVSIVCWLGVHRDQNRSTALLILAITGGVFVILGILEIVFAVKRKDGKLKKTFFLLTGISVVSIPVCAVLHNVVYGLFFTGKQGDEAVFFILALIVCPILFAIGTLGSVICGIVGMKK